MCRLNCAGAAVKTVIFDEVAKINRENTANIENNVQTMCIKNEFGLMGTLHNVLKMNELLTISDIKVNTYVTSSTLFVRVVKTCSINI